MIFYQVDITVDSPVGDRRISQLAIEQGQKEFGESDETEIEEIELI